MEANGNERLPQFHSSPNGIARMKQLPTIEASNRYREAVRVHAIETRHRGTTEGKDREIGQPRQMFQHGVAHGC